MLKFLYILFYLTLNIFLFSILLKKNFFNARVKQLLLASLLIFIVLHYLNVFSSFLDNKIFLILLYFSFSIFIFHFGNKFVLNFKLDENDFKNKKVFVAFFSKWVYYIFLVSISIFQALTILKKTQ